MGWGWEFVKDVVGVLLDPEGNYTGGKGPDVDEEVSEEDDLEPTSSLESPDEFVADGGYDYGEWGAGDIQDREQSLREEWPLSGWDDP